MKKILVFMLLLAMICVTACDNKNNSVNSDVNSNDVNSNGNTNVSAGEDKTPVGDTDSSTQESTEDPHKGWTLLFGKIYIPDLPFEDWEGENQDNISCYTIFIKSNNSAAFHSYVQSLTDFGYTIEQTESYAYKGTDPENRSIHFTDHENGQMKISIYY